LRSFYGRPNRVPNDAALFSLIFFGYRRAPSALFFAAFDFFPEILGERKRFFCRDSDFKRRRYNWDDGNFFSERYKRRKLEGTREKIRSKDALKK